MNKIPALPPSQVDEMMERMMRAGWVERTVLTLGEGMVIRWLPAGIEQTDKLLEIFAAVDIVDFDDARLRALAGACFIRKEVGIVPIDD